MTVIIVACAFEPLDEMIIPLKFAEKVTGTNVYIHHHTDQRIRSLFAQSNDRRRLLIKKELPRKMSGLDANSNLCQPMQDCSCAVGSSIWFGIKNSDGTIDTTDGKYTSANVLYNPVLCDTTSFGNQDPAPGQTKYCWCGTSNQLSQNYAQRIYDQITTSSGALLIGNQGSWPSDLKNINPPIFVDLVNIIIGNGYSNITLRFDGLKLTEPSQYWDRVLSHQTFPESPCFEFLSLTMEYDDAKTIQTIMQNVVMGSRNGFYRVRHAIQGTQWYPSTDKLRGSDVFGTPYDDTGFWATKFDSVQFDQFLFMSTDGAKWMVMDKESVLGGYSDKYQIDFSEFYHNEDRYIEKSSSFCQAYQAKQYRRQEVAEDPWFSITDHSNYQLLYGANSYNAAYLSVLLQTHGGMDVYIRDSKNPSITLPPVTPPTGDCNPVDIKLLKDQDGTSLDNQSGKGVISYDSGNDVIVVDKSVRGGKFSCQVKISLNSGDISYFPLTVYVFRIVFEPQKIIRQLVYNDGQNDLISLDELIANNITFYGETGFEIVPSIFELKDNSYVAYESEKIYVENRVVNIKKERSAHHTKFLKVKETNFTAEGFSFYLPIEITVCAFPTIDDVEPVRIRGEGFTSSITRGQSYFVDQKISKLFQVVTKECKVQKQSLKLVKDETGEDLDDSTGLGIVSYDSAEDLILVDRTIKSGKFEFFVQGTINENMTVHYPVVLDMKIYYNPAPMFESAGEEAPEPMYLFVELTELDISQGKIEIKTIESPLVIDNEGDAIYFEFSGFEVCPAITCEGFGATDELIIDHFRCNVNEKLITKACNGTHNIVVNFFDESIDQHLRNSMTFKIEINFIFEGRDDEKSGGFFAGVVIDDDESEEGEDSFNSKGNAEEEQPPPELKIKPMTTEGELSFEFNQDMALPEGGMDYEALISFAMKSSADNSLKKAEFVTDPEQAEERRRMLQQKSNQHLQHSLNQRRSLGWIKDERIKDVNEYAAYLKKKAEEDYDSVWGQTAEVPKAADSLSCFWYVQSHTGKEIKFKFSFNNPNSVSSGSFGQDQIIVDIKDLSQFESSGSGKKVSADSFEGGTPQISQSLPPIVANVATAEALNESADLMTKVTTFISGGNLVTSLVLGGSMQYLWGMIRAMQMITMMSLIRVTLPAYAQVFFSGAILFANMDVFSGEAIYAEHLDFRQTEPLNERFESMGMDSQNFVYNSGSYFILLILIYLSFYMRIMGNYICTKFAQYWWVRSLGIYILEKNEEPIEMFKASVKLFQEAYFDNTMANILGLSGMYVAYTSNEFHVLWSSSHNILCSTVTIIWATLHIIFPIWQYRKMSAMARHQESGLVDSDHDANLYFKVLCEGMSTYNKTTYLYNFYFIVQRLIIALSLILLRELPMLQFVIFVTISLYRIQFIIKYSPFKEAKDNAVELFNELTILLVICLMHSMLIANLSKQERITLGWALIIGSAVNIVGNMLIVIYFSSQDVAKVAKSSKEKSERKKILEQRLFSDSMILPDISITAVIEMREEFKALQWMKEYMPHRHWMQHNGIDLKEIPDEIHYQELESKFHFSKRRQQIMMEFSLIKASKVLLEKDEKQFAQDQIKAFEEQKRLKKEAKRKLREASRLKFKQLQPDHFYGDEQDSDDESLEGIDQDKQDQDEDSLVEPVFRNKKFGKFLKSNDLVQRTFMKKITAIKEESIQITDRSECEEEKFQLKLEAKQYDQEERIQRVKDEMEISLWEQVALQKEKKDQIVNSGRVQMIYNNDRFFSIDKFSDLVMGDNFSRNPDGKRIRNNKLNYESKRKYGVIPKAIMDLRFMSDDAKKEQTSLEDQIVERMQMTQEKIDQEMINETESSMILKDGGSQGQMASVILVLAEIKEFRNFVITSPDAANEKNHCTYLIRRIFKQILAKQITMQHLHTNISIKPFYLEWKYNKDDSVYASEFWNDINNMFEKELSPKLAPDFQSQPWEGLNVDKMKLFNECFPQITSFLFECVLKGKIQCQEHDSEDEPQILNYTKVKSFEMELIDNLGSAFKNYFSDKTIRHKCQKCNRETNHEQEDLEIMVAPSILSFTVPRFDNIDRQDSKFNYPIIIDFVHKFSTDYQPTYELFAVIANRGDTLFSGSKNSNYVAIIKRKNGDVIEFDPSADGPKRLSSDNDLLKEKRTVEMLFYREIRPDESQNNSDQDSSLGSSLVSNNESSEEEQQKESKAQEQVEMVHLKSKFKQLKTRISKDN